MKAIVVDDPPDLPLRWQEVPDPEPREDEVLLRIHATAVNRADLLQRRGLYPPPPGAPEWMGLEASGVIEAVSTSERAQGGTAPAGSDEWKVGDLACCLLAGGGYAEKVAVHRDLLLPVPEGVSLEEAASLPEVFATAYLNLFFEAGLQSGETVLIHAGASGVGIAAIQLAHARGARVFTTVGTSQKAELARALGSDVVLVHSAEDVTLRLRELCAERGLDVVLDCLGGEELAAHLPLLNVGGRWVLIALLKGARAQVDLRLILSRRLRLIGSTLRSRPREEKARVLQALRTEVWPKFASRAVRPIVHAVLPITRAQEAHAILERRENLGKVVLRVSER